MNTENSTLPTKLIKSELYFCGNCNQGWKDNKWMECCKGCVGHRDMGWTIDDMKHVYGTAMDALIKQLRSPEYYFPCIKREKCARRLSFSPFRTYYNKNILQPFAKYELDWRIQQANLLRRFSNNPCKMTWDSLDPEVQRKVVYKHDIRY